MVSASAVVPPPGNDDGKQAIQIAVGLERKLRHFANKRLELIAARDKIGFRVHLDDGALAARDRKADESIGGDPAALLRGLGQTLLAQQIDRGLDVAFRFGERALAVHHARARLLAQVFHHTGGNRHGSVSLSPHRTVEHYA